MSWLTNIFMLFLVPSIVSYVFWLSVVGYFAYSIIKR